MWSEKGVEKFKRETQKIEGDKEKNKETVNNSVKYIVSKRKI